MCELTPEFKPTAEWVCIAARVAVFNLCYCVLNVQVRAWKHKLPLNTVLRVLQVLVPQVEKLCSEKYVFHGVNGH